MKKPSMKLIALMLYAFSITACATPSQVYWDSKVKELCEKDGGVTIFEKVEISKQDYPNLKLTSKGAVILPSESLAKPNDPFFVRFESVALHGELKTSDESLRVARSVTSIVRKKDNKVLSQLVTYSRGGGDFLPDGIFQPSGYSCENQEDDFHIFASTITVKGE